MSTSAAYAIQTALYGLLSADAAMITALSTRVYWDVPDNTDSFPYYSMGETTDVTTDTFNKICHNVTVTHHVFDKRDNYEGPLNVNTVMSRATALIDRVTLTVTGGTAYYCRREFETIMRESENIWHGVLRFRIQFQES